MENENITPEIKNEAPTTPVTQVVTANKSSGALIGTIIVIVILVIGGFYLWSTRVQPKIEQQAVPPAETQQTTALADPALTTLSSQGASDETIAIESDLAATDIDSIDQELQTI